MNAIEQRIRDAKKGTFSYLTTTAKGVLRGRGADRKLYNDHRKKYKLITGYKYNNILGRSLDVMERIDLVDVVAENDGFDIFHAQEAFESVWESLTRSRAGENTSTTDAVRGPVVATNPETGESEILRGCWRHTETGTLYLYALVEKSWTLQAPSNGYWKTNSKPLTLAKRAIERTLPIGKIRGFTIEAGADFSLILGGVEPLDGWMVATTTAEELRDIAAMVEQGDREQPTEEAGHP